MQNHDYDNTTMKKRTFKQLAAISLVSLIALQLQAQVTIGAGLEPAKGSLLDLKQYNPKADNTTSTKGLMLPRITLTDPNKLYPMFEKTPGSGTANSDYDTDAKKRTQDAQHTGLWVYNLTQCDGKFARGVYTWTGMEWVQLTNNLILTGNPTLIFTPALPADNMIHIPSGQDLRTLTAYTLFVTFGETNQVTGAWANNISGGLVFTANPLAPQFPAIWSTSPISDISVFPDVMTVTDLTSNPFLTRESKLTITGLPGTGSCPGGGTIPRIETIILNQTNYSILAGSVSNPIKHIIIKDTNSVNLEILSNVAWQANAVSDGSSWNVRDILQSYTTDLKDSTTADGTTGSNDNFVYKGANADIGKRYTTATVTFKDPLERAKDFVINVKQCQGTPDMTGVQYDATPSETSGANNTWNGDIVRHLEKRDAANKLIYAEFYSAQFGNAGRWMITNLAAEAYDDIAHQGGRTLTRNANSGNAYNTAYWAYPNVSGQSVTSDAEYKKNSFLGYLYTWDAATAGKGSIPYQDGVQNGIPYINAKTSTGGNQRVFDGRYNRDKAGGPNDGWIGDQTEAGMMEWDGVSVRDAITTTQVRRQGICPKGWHLPSDYEWTQLEQEIIRLTTSFADVQNNIVTQGNVQQPTVVLNKNDENATDLWRGTTHGQAMKDICESSFTGTSRSTLNNGFAILLAGYVDNGQAGGYGADGIYWTSSISHGTAVSGRIFNKDENRVHRYRPYRYYQFPVRCKKD
jgi:uncharacterized protein (TIGR02145 family)